VLKTSKPDRVDGLRDRTNEVWRPLLAIADLGGEAWAAAARRSALGLAAGADDDDKASLGLLLLSDIRDVFASRKVERIKTSDLIVALAAFSESPWGEWWLDQRASCRCAAHPANWRNAFGPTGSAPTTPCGTAGRPRRVTGARTSSTLGSGSFPLA
jgi:hypothetical protein